MGCNRIFVAHYIIPHHPRRSLVGFSRYFVISRLIEWSDGRGKPQAATTTIWGFGWFDERSQLQWEAATKKRNHGKTGWGGAIENRKHREYDEVRGRHSLRYSWAEFRQNAVLNSDGDPPGKVLPN